MKQKLTSARTSAFALLLLANLATANLANALVLQRGTEADLAGTLGDVQVNYIDDSVSVTGYLDNSGLVTPAPTPIQATRIQYDVLNNAGNGNIFEFRVDYAPSTIVIGAGDPTGFYDGGGNDYDYWGGIAYVTLFDAGYGTYTYNGNYGSEWAIDYTMDHVSWRQLGNGFFEDTATGLTEFGFNPTFSLYFDPNVPLGLQNASVSGVAVTGGSVSSSGRVLSAVSVPEPHTLALMGIGLFGLLRFRQTLK